MTNTYSAQFGGNGSVVNAVSKTGTNDLHGSAYEFLRNSALDSRNFFDYNTEGQPDKPEFRRNQFGGSLGGPIKKDKMFFFVNYDGLRQALGQSEGNVAIPETYVASDELPSGPFGAPVPNLLNSNPAAGCAALTAPTTKWGPVSGFETGSNPVEPEVAFGSGQPAQQAAAATTIAGILGLYTPFQAGAAAAADQGGFRSYGAGSAFGAYGADSQAAALSAAGAYGDFSDWRLDGADRRPDRAECDAQASDA